MVECRKVFLHLQLAVFKIVSKGIVIETFHVIAARVECGLKVGVSTLEAQEQL